MHNIALTLIAPQTLALNAYAQTRCTTDSLGNNIYRDNNGNTTRCRTDSLGDTTCY